MDSGTTGATTPATAWTLSAAGPTPVSGVTGAPAVTAAPVQVGTYDLAESGPAGFTASDWVCTGAATATATSVTLAEGEHATCTITNTAVAPKLTLVKAVDTTSAGGTATPTDWTLTATGPTNLSGTSGDPSVTERDGEGRRLRAGRVRRAGRLLGLGVVVRGRRARREHA